LAERERREIEKHLQDKRVAAIESVDEEMEGARERGLTS